MSAYQQSSNDWFSHSPKRLTAVPPLDQCDVQDLISYYISPLHKLGHDGEAWWVLTEWVVAGNPSPCYVKNQLIPSHLVHQALSRGWIEYFGPKINSLKEFKIQQALGMVSYMQMAQLTNAGEMVHVTARSALTPEMYSSSCGDFEVTYTSSTNFKG